MTRSIPDGAFLANVVGDLTDGLACTEQREVQHQIAVQVGVAAAMNQIPWPRASAMCVRRMRCYTTGLNCCAAACAKSSWAYAVGCIASKNMYCPCEPPAACSTPLDELVRFPVHSGSVTLLNP